MAGDFFKGEKKKKKKGSDSGPISFAPIFVPPKIVPKGKDKKYN